MKRNAFEYLLTLLIEWHQQVTEDDNAYLNDFSKLSILKLLFFTAAVPNGTEEEDLLDIFNNFAALRHGPVESDIYNSLNNQEFQYLNIDIPKFTLIKPEEPISDIRNKIDLNDKIKDRIETSIAVLRDRNKKIVTYSSFDLVDITHKWNCWRINYDLADLFGMGSYPIDSTDIKLSDKYYFT